MNFFNVKNLSDTSAEIEVYGEIVEKRPTNWWGDELEGMYFVSSEFNSQIAKLKNVKDITLKINSPGGDLFVGVGVYNKLKQLDANITVVVEGLAASAAGLIACAGDTVKLGVGAVFMAHQASTFVPEWYVNETDVEEYQRQLEACNKAVAEIISAKTGKTVEEIMPLLKEELWLSGQEAIDFGFADEMLDENGSQNGTYIDPSKNSIFSNGRVFAIKNCVVNATQHIQTMETEDVKSPTDNGEETKYNKEDTEMSLAVTVEMLRKDHPDIVKDIETQAVSNALTAERQRQKDIDGIAHLISDKAVLDKAKYGDGDDAVSAKDLLWNVAQSQDGQGANFLASVKKDVKASSVDDVEAAPSGSDKTDEEKVGEQLNSAVEFFNKNK